jgi:undecaprenyl-diphosphatase
MTDTLAAILLGILEGLTEFLPVSSTGHLILATEVLGFNQHEWEVFNIAIQPAAILAIVVLYWRTFWDVAKGLFGLEKGALNFVRNLAVAFLPAVLLGLAFGDVIEGFLGNAVLVCWTLILGGVAILAIERWANPPAEGLGVAGVPLRTAVVIGLVQCLAMIPGVSRSGATILGAMAFGVDRKTAAEFSFFLAVPTLAGATVYQMTKHAARLTAYDLELIGIGSLAGFVTALVVVKGFVAVVTRIGFAPFAWYRIVIGGAGLVWLTLR